MTTFQKIPLKPSKGRDKLGRINTKVGKNLKTPSIVRVHDLELSSPTISLISRILPQIERVSSFNFPKQVKTAIIANIVDQAAQSMEESSSPSSSFRSPVRGKFSSSSTPKFSTPALKSPKIRDSLLNELSHLFNSKGQVLDQQGDPIPDSDINRVASWMKNTNPKSRGPIGVQAVAFDLAQKSGELPKHIKNPHFLRKTRTLKEELSSAQLKKRRRQEVFAQNRRLIQEGSGKWQSLGIRY